jgi:stress response protein YsnF
LFDDLYNTPSSEVTEKPYVKEEVVVKKKPVTETKEVTEETTSENVNTSGE